MWVLAAKAVPDGARRIADASASPTSKGPVAGADCGERRRHGEDVFPRTFRPSSNLLEARTLEGGLAVSASAVPSGNDATRRRPREGRRVFGHVCLLRAGLSVASRLSD